MSYGYFSDYLFCDMSDLLFGVLWIYMQHISSDFYCTSEHIHMQLQYIPISQTNSESCKLYFTATRIQSSFLLQAVRLLVSSSALHHKNIFYFMTYQTWISWISTLWQALRKSYDNPAEVASSFADIPFFFSLCRPYRHISTKLDFSTTR